MTTATLRQWAFVVLLLLQKVTAYYSATTRIMKTTRITPHVTPFWENIRSQSLVNARSGFPSIYSTAKSFVTIEKEEEEDDECNDTQDGSLKMKVRPFHQNWWPVSTLSALDESRPNALTVLGRRLVAYHSQKEWHVLEDRCSHRFAPLSEGRVVTAERPEDDGQTCHLQCAYHGWEFDSAGICRRLPQQPEATDKARSVQVYPVRVRAGMLWVWTDPTSAKDLAETVPLPVDPLLDRYVDHFGPGACYMRDLPYGMELLGENLIDLSHLPFAHHSLGNLKRELGVSLPMRMVSESGRTKNAAWEKQVPYNKQESVLPTFEAEVIDPANHDPIMISMPNSMNNSDTWTTTIGFYSPCHVRYRRWRGPGMDGHVELFMCPKTEGRSRVFLFNCFESILPDPNAKANSRQSILTVLRKPRTWNGHLRKFIFRRLLDPRRVAGHMIAHQIFDGDGIFLHKQGNRMKEAGLSYKDYSTPSSADIMLNAYRRFLQRAAIVTRQSGEIAYSNAVVGTEKYGDDAPRSEMLDRFNTHTVNCPTCFAALKKARVTKSRLHAFKIALYSAFGVSATLAMYTWSFKKSFPLVPAAYIRFLATATGLTGLFSVITNRLGKQLDDQINSFLFVDYVHADKH